MPATLTAMAPVVQDAPPVDYLYITHPGGLTHHIDQFLAANGGKPVCIDTETTGLDVFTLTPLLLQLYQEGYPALIIDCRSISLPVIAEAVRPILEGEAMLKVGHHLPYDLAVIKHHLGLDVNRIYDTWAVEKLLTAGLYEECGLAQVAQRYLGLYLDKEVRKQFIGLTPDAVISSEMLAYSAADVGLLMPIVRAQQKRLAAEKMVEIARLEFSVIPALVEAHLWGVQIDEAHYRAYIEELEQEAERQALVLQDELQPFIDQYRLEKNAGQMEQYQLDLADYEMVKGFRE